MNTLTDLFMNMEQIAFAVNDETKLTAQQAMLMGISAAMMALAKKLNISTDVLTDQIALSELLPMLQIIELKPTIDNVEYRVL